MLSIIWACTNALFYGVVDPFEFVQWSNCFTFARDKYTSFAVSSLSVDPLSLSLWHFWFIHIIWSYELSNVLANNDVCMHIWINHVCVCVCMYMSCAVCKHVLFAKVCAGELARALCFLLCALFIALFDGIMRCVSFRCRDTTSLLALASFCRKQDNDPHRRAERQTDKRVAHTER